MNAPSDEQLSVVANIQVGVQPVGVAVDVHDHVFVTNSGSNTVSVIDSLTNTVSTTINVGLRPEGVATDPQFGVCVANSGSRTMSMIDRFNAVVATVSTGGPPGLSFGTRVAVDHILSRAYMTNRFGDRVSVFHISSDPLPFTRDFIGVTGSLGVAVDSLNHRVYVTRPDANAVSVVDPAKNEVVATVPVHQQPSGIAVDAQRHRAYVANLGFDAVSVIDTDNGSVTDVTVAAGPNDVTLDSRGNVYVTHVDGTVTVLDATSHNVNAIIPVGSHPEGLAFEPHSDRVYVANRDNGTVTAVGLSPS
ncbi:YncE family protein [Streptomyces sp. NPDC016469]|uniref:YncE family protein n=1 Tax=Streptomyces sp. NPDC016469 TaxID=3157191 RepID=UPI003402EB35